MALKNQVRLCVGFLIGDVETEEQHRRGPIGTFFAIQRTDDLWRDQPAGPHGDVFMVTAKHVIQGQPDLEARMRNKAGEWTTHSASLPTGGSTPRGYTRRRATRAVENFGERDHEPVRRKLRDWLRVDGSIGIQHESRHPLPLSGLHLCTLNRGTMLLSLTPPQP